jgi:RNA polymerase primary sigma factor
MRQINDKNLAELLLQLRYSPQKKRYDQINAIERLVSVINKDKQYPFEFVYFRITGFQLKGPIDPYTVNGTDLLDDLRVFVTKLSTSAAPDVTDVQEKVFTVEELARHLLVSSKTLNRWRKRGLVVRKFVFPDGIKRLGVLSSSFDHFSQSHPDLVSRASSFNRLTVDQINELVQRAKSHAAADLSRHQVIERLARHTGRAHETVRYILLEYEKNHPRSPLFSKPAGVISPTSAARIYEAYKTGTPVNELMCQHARSRSSIYRIINQRRAAALFARKIAFVDSPEFKDEHICMDILAEDIAVEEPMAPLAFESYEMLGEQLLPEYLQVLKESAVLNSDLELKLFRRYNCLKYMAQRIRAKIKMTRVSSQSLKQSEGYLAEAEEIERRIVEANLRLVVGIASRHSGSGTGFAELVSKGNYALIKAVQEFDYTVGFRFGKRASLSIAKEYAKASGKNTELSRTRAASIGTMQRHLRDSTDIGAIERTRLSLTQVIRDELDKREQYIILNHFGLIGSGIKKQTQTLQQIGDTLGITKERVRQIELIALQKLRQCLSSEEFELLTA